MTHIKHAAVLILLFCMMVGAVSAQQATVREFSGKVTYQEPGGLWKPVNRGMTLPLNATISTGFRSTAVLELRDANINVAQLTRMAIEDLRESQGTVTTSVNLKVGKVQAKVRTGANLTHDFKLRSPVSTAAVRGTEFVYKVDGVVVTEGEVLFFELLAERQTSLLAGQESETDGSGNVTSPEQAYDERASVQEGLLGDPFDTIGGLAGTGTIIVDYE